MAKDIKALIIPDEKIAEDIDVMITSMKAKLKRLEGQQCSVRKVEEFEALSSIMCHYETIQQLLEMTRQLLRKK